ncbi:MAG: hypothetical protein RLN86_11620 [Cyclobacteriaceae bacterium]
MRFQAITIFILLLSSLAQAQNDGPKKFTFRGYLKNMSSLNYVADQYWYENLTHNRLNFAWYPKESVSAYVEFRNRLFLGDFVNEFPNYGELINSNNDFFNLSTNVIDNQSAILNVMVDRAFLQWNKNDWEVKLGRQRINWGVNLAWNPNDWFNAYSFFDFDYEERPGSDALRISKYTGAASSIEVAAKIAEDVDRFVGAAMWRINASNYDMQFLAGVAQGDLALGTGWAGNLGNAGFKGELTYFTPVVDTRVNEDYNQMLLGAVSIDYSFASSLYLNGSVMYNSKAELDPEFGFAFTGVRLGNFTVRDISQYRWSSFIQSTYQFSPLIFGGMAVIAYPGSNAFFLNPMVTFSLRQNFDLDLVGQIFFDEKPLSGDYGAVSEAAFARLKWSF